MRRILAGILLLGSGTVFAMGGGGGFNAGVIPVIPPRSPEAISAGVIPVIPPRGFEAVTAGVIPVIPPRSFEAGVIPVIPPRPGR